MAFYFSVPDFVVFPFYLSTLCVWNTKTYSAIEIECENIGRHSQDWLVEVVQVWMDIIVKGTVFKRQQERDMDNKDKLFEVVRFRRFYCLRDIFEGDINWL